MRPGNQFVPKRTEDKCPHQSGSRTQASTAIAAPRRITLPATMSTPTKSPMAGRERRGRVERTGQATRAAADDRHQTTETLAQMASRRSKAQDSWTDKAQDVIQPG